MAMYGYVWRYMAIHGDIWLCMYGYVCIAVCMYANKLWLLNFNLFYYNQ